MPFRLASGPVTSIIPFESGTMPGLSSASGMPLWLESVPDTSIIPGGAPDVLATRLGGCNPRGGVSWDPCGGGGCEPQKLVVTVVGGGVPLLPNVAVLHCVGGVGGNAGLIGGHGPGGPGGPGPKDGTWTECHAPQGAGGHGAGGPIVMIGGGPGGAPAEHLYDLPGVYGEGMPLGAEPPAKPSSKGWRLERGGVAHK